MKGSFNYPDRKLIHEILDEIDKLLLVSREYSPAITELLRKLSDYVGRSRYNLQLEYVNSAINELYNIINKEAGQVDITAIENFFILNEDIVLRILAVETNYI